MRKLITNQLVLLFALTQWTLVYAEPVPLLVDYTGQISINSDPVQAAGKFRFQILNGNCGIDGGIGTINCEVFWSSDGSIDGNLPSEIEIPISDGLFSIKLGDDSILNVNSVAMPVLGADIFKQNITYLRIWFDDGQNGLQQLVPDRQLVAVPYALRAEVSNQVDDQAIMNVAGLSVKGQSAENAFTVDTENNFIGIGTSNPGKALHIVSTTRGKKSSNARILIENNIGNQYFLNTFYNQDFFSIGRAHEDPFNNPTMVGNDIVINRSGKVGIATTPNAEDPSPLQVNGSISALSLITPSSKKIKKAINELEYGLDDVLKLKAKKFQYKDDPQHMSHIGFMAEDMHEIIPELVQYDTKGHARGIDYAKLSVVLTSAIKDLNIEMKKLKMEIEALKRN